MRVITFSRAFPVKHPKAGKPTRFVEKIWESIYMDNAGSSEFASLDKSVFDISSHGIYEPKHHTIRAGNRWKSGDFFSPRVWSGKPYASKQIQFAPTIQVKKIWDFELRIEQDGGGDIQILTINGNEFFWYDGGYNNPVVKELCENDGLTEEEFINWFLIHPKMKQEGFKGQILCWHESIAYPNLKEINSTFDQLATA